MEGKCVEGYRNCATKLWNAARFLQSNGVAAATSHEAPHAEAPVNRWIVAETVATVQAIDIAMAELRFDAAAHAIYHFVWDQFCDWYIELTKDIGRAACRERVCQYVEIAGDALYITT